MTNLPEHKPADHKPAVDHKPELAIAPAISSALQRIDVMRRIWGPHLSFIGVCFLCGVAALNLARTDGAMYGTIALTFGAQACALLMMLLRKQEPGRDA